MPQHSFAMGQAGTGKTTWLITQIRDNAGRILVREQQRLLGLTFMHGARRRLAAAIKSACPTVRATVSTIDSFALYIVNRWRSTLGFKKVVSGGQGNGDFQEQQYTFRAGFECILKAATDLLRTSTVSKVIGNSYPLVVIDEFQDCHGRRLEFIQQLGSCSQLMVAADEFQLLDTAVAGCPAVDWARQLNANGHAAVNELQQIHRTSDAAIISTAKALRTGNAVPNACVPVQCFSGPGQAAFRILEAVYWKHPKGQPFGSRAIIAPSRVSLLSEILQSLEDQCKKRDLTALHWRGDLSETEIVGALTNKLLGKGNGDLNLDSLKRVDCNGDPFLTTSCSRLLKLFRIKGLTTMSKALVVDTLERVVHGIRSHGPTSVTCVVTTVHGAKNREFDDVFVVWPYQIAPGADLQRRLLYNAITRAKRRCYLFVQGGVKRAKADGVLQLLGTPVPVFPAKSKAPKTAKGGGKKQN